MAHVPLLKRNQKEDVTMSIETKHLVITEAKPKPKTKVWNVHNKHTKELLGQVLWYAPFRQYCFDDGIIYAESCLNDLGKFLHDQMALRKVEKTERLEKIRT